VQVKLARLFCVDNYGEDQREYGLDPAGLYCDVGEQYAFAAEERGIDHSHYLLWAEDTLEIIAQGGDTRSLSPNKGSNAPAVGEVGERVRQSGAASQIQAVVRGCGARRRRLEGEDHKGSRIEGYICPYMVIITNWGLEGEDRGTGGRGEEEGGMLLLMASVRKLEMRQKEVWLSHVRIW